MKRQDYLQLIQEYTDKNGMVKPQRHWSDSGNGLTYTAYDMQFRRKYKIEQRKNYKKLVMSCMMEPGLLARTPQNTFGNQQHDDIQSVLAGCVIDGNKEVPFLILKRLALNFGFYDTNNEKESKDFIGRFLYLWPSLIAASSDILKWAVFPLLCLYTLTFKPNKNDTSGINLQWSFLEYMDALYPWNPFKKRWEAKLYEEFQDGLFGSMSIYFDNGHPFVRLVKEGISD